MTSDERDELIEFLKGTKKELFVAVREMDIKDDLADVKHGISDKVFRCARCHRWLDTEMEEGLEECIECSEAE